MASLRMNFMKRTADGKDDVIYSTFIVANKMSEKWVRENYGANSEDVFYYASDKENNPYGPMWIIERVHEKFWNRWVVLQLHPQEYKEVCPIKYDYLIVQVK